MKRSNGLPATARVVLIGPMGSGKSTVGAILAERTGWPLLDNDALLVRATGASARELLADAGEAALRDRETAALRVALATPPPAIVTAAAGVILDPTNRASLADAGLVVWLRAPVEVLAARAAGADWRPWLDADPAAWFTESAVVRDPLYASVADLELDTATMAPGEMVEAILDALARG